VISGEVINVANNDLPVTLLWVMKFVISHDHLTKHNSLCQRQLFPRAMKFWHYRFEEKLTLEVIFSWEGLCTTSIFLRVLCQQGVGYLSMGGSSPELKYEQAKTGFQVITAAIMKREPSGV
jgi:hypothetical protein